MARIFLILHVSVGEWSVQRRNTIKLKQTHTEKGKCGTLKVKGLWTLTFRTTRTTSRRSERMIHEVFLVSEVIETLLNHFYSGLNISNLLKFSVYCFQNLETKAIYFKLCQFPLFPWNSVNLPTWAERSWRRSRCVWGVRWARTRAPETQEGRSWPRSLWMDPPGTSWWASSPTAPRPAPSNRLPASTPTCPRIWDGFWTTLESDPQLPI